MNFEKQMYDSGLTAQGCWDEMDSYMREAIDKFGELIIRRCISEVAMMGVSQWENPDISWATQMITSNIKDIFEMKEQDV
jgi:alkylhydroperoxidase/carboxymuconolactone decarboxylase family protein YurZ